MPVEFREEVLCGSVWRRQAEHRSLEYPSSVHSEPLFVLEDERHLPVEAKAGQGINECLILGSWQRVAIIHVRSLVDLNAGMRGKK